MKSFRAWLSISLISTFLMPTFMSGTTFGAQFINFAGGATGGAYLVIAIGMSKIVEQHVPGIRTSAQVTGGGFENARLVGTKRAEIGLTTPDVAYFAIRGGGTFKPGEKYELRALMGGHSSIQHFVTLEEISIKSIKDYRGRRVSLGQPGSATEVLGSAILEVYGITKKDLKAEYLTQTEAIAALRDGTVDATIQLSGVPGGALVDLAARNNARFIPIEPDMMEAIIKKHPYWYSSRIPAGTYRGVKEDVPAVAAGTVVIVHKDFDEDLAYKITKAILENSKELAEMHGAGKEYTFENAGKGVPIPFHPGAERYLREKGVLK